MGRYIVARKVRTRSARKQRARLEMAVGRHCPYCGHVMRAKLHDGPPDRFRSPLAPTIDHVFPQSMGGTAKMACCFLCNHNKGDKTPSEWLAYVQQIMPHRVEAVRNVLRSFGLQWTEPIDVASTDGGSS